MELPKGGKLRRVMEPRADRRIIEISSRRNRLQLGVRIAAQLIDSFLPRQAQRGDFWLSSLGGVGDCCPL